MHMSTTELCGGGLISYYRWKQAQEDLRESIKILEIKKKEIKESIEVAKYRDMIPNTEVVVWLQETEVCLSLTKELVEQLANLHNGCFGIRNCFGQRQLKKKVFETMDRVEDLMKGGQFEQGVSHKIPPVNPVDDELVGFQHKVEEVMNCLNSDECKVIGLCGMGGVGKTTLIEKVHKALSKYQSSGFEVVIRVLLTQDVNIDFVQEDILRQIHLEPDTNNRYGKEEYNARIYKILKKKTFLLVLDDIWAEINLLRLGIPSLDGSRSKIIVISRDMNVCTKMGVDKTIMVDPLNSEDAWTLFRKTVGGDILSSNKAIQKIALRIVQEFSGLPLAIKAVAGALRGRDDVTMWHEALQQIIKPESNGQHYDKLLHGLKISYDYLDIYIQRCFIHCCLFPEDILIDKDLLIEQWLGRGFLDESQSRSTSFRDTGCNIIEDLVSKCLLQDKRNSVTLNDLIRYMGISTTLSAGKSIVKAGTNLSQVPNLESWEEIETMSLIDCHIEKLVNIIPLCPKLSTLILSKNNLYSIHPNFFMSFPALTFLDLSWSGIEELPNEAIGELVLLRYLNISHTNLSDLPSSIKELVNLEVFDLSYVAQLRAIPSGLLKHLAKLKILNIFHCGYENWVEEEEEEAADGLLPMDSTALLEELGQSSTLIDLGLSVVGKDGFNKLQSVQKLLDCTRSLSVAQQEKVDSLPLDSIQSMTNLDTLQIYKCDDLLEIKHNQVAWGKGISNQPFFVNLHHVIIKYCWMLTELSWVCFVPNLRSLVVERCNNVNKIVSDDVIVEELKPKASEEIFASLENLYLGYLPQLESIINIPLNFDRLEELKVMSCPILKKLPLHSKSSPHKLKRIEGNQKWWQELQWDDNLTSGALVPYFKEMVF